MIAFVEGTVSAKATDSLTVQIGGVGIQVFTSPMLIQRHEVGDLIRLNTKLIVREDAWTLYGFESMIEKEYFELLLGVSGVGPKSALSVLSNLSVDQLRSAVLAEQPDTFARVPGVGRKTGQKIILHLQGKVGELTAEIGDVRIQASDIDLLEAMTGLGYSVAEAQRAIQSIPATTQDDLEEKLRIALQFFSK